MKKYHAVALLLVICVVVGGVFLWRAADRSEAHSVSLSEAIAVPVPDRENSARVFVKIANSGVPQKLTAVNSADAEKAYFEKVEPGTSPVIPAQGAASMAMDGAYIVLEDIEGPMEDGRLLTFNLNLEPAGEVSAKARFVATPPMMHGMADHSGGHAGMSMKKKSHEDGPHMAMSVAQAETGDRWIVDLTVHNFRFAEDLVDGEHVPGTGHGHLYLNGVKLGRVFSNRTEIGELPTGTHLVRVTLNKNNHQVYMAHGKPVTETVRITVP